MPLRPSLSTGSDSSSEGSRSRSPSPILSKSGIRPNHYYEPGGIPVFCPTMEQFEDFGQFVEDIYAYGHIAGIVKVIPPPEWVASLPPIDAKLAQVEEFQPISQLIYGSRGCYTQTNIESRKRYTVDTFRALARSIEHRRPPPHQERGSESTRSRTTATTRRMTRQRQQQQQRQTRSRQPIHASKGNKEEIEMEEEETDAKIKDDDDDNEDDEYYDEHEDEEDDDDDDDELEVKKRKIDRKSATRVTRSQRVLRSSQSAEASTSISPPVSPAQLHDSKDADPDEENEQSDSEEPMEEFSFERCQELERDYWRNLTYNPPYYGADIPGSLFDDSVTCWNVAHLKNLLDNLPVSLPGVNSPYLYFGMWKSTFAWHVEDMDLFSINYIHYGAPKQWYSISEAHRNRFELVAQGIWSPDYQKCPEFLRHKTFIISPKALANYSIPVNRLVQKEHEFVLTFPRGYHAGYNLGYNCAESVNFALESWIPFGKKARSCQCIGDSVHIDMDAFFASTDQSDDNKTTGDINTSTTDDNKNSNQSSVQQAKSPLLSVDKEATKTTCSKSSTAHKSSRMSSMVASPSKRQAISSKSTNSLLDDKSSSGSSQTFVNEVSLAAAAASSASSASAPPIKRRKQNEVSSSNSNSTNSKSSQLDTHEVQRTTSRDLFDLILNSESPLSG